MGGQVLHGINHPTALSLEVYRSSNGFWASDCGVRLHDDIGQALSQALPGRTEAQVRSIPLPLDKGLCVLSAGDVEKRKWHVEQCVGCTEERQLFRQEEAGPSNMLFCDI